jgi:hypothetical protein
MAYPDFTAAVVMDQAAVYNNDPSKTIYTYAKQIPLLNGALQELQEIFELNDIPVTQVTSSPPLSVPIGTSVIGFGTTPALPSDLVEPKLVWERPLNLNPYVPMNKVDFLPQQLAGVPINQFIWYVWQKQQIEVLPATQINEIKIEYVRFLFATIAASTDTLSVINCKSFLEYRTAALIASLLGENPTRAGELNGFAASALDTALGIGTKGRQAIMTRHRPFRSGYKRGSTV